MAQEHWRRGALGDEVENFLLEESPQELHVRAITNWNRWLQLTEGAECLDFTSSLSIAQFNAHRILLELWTGGGTGEAVIKTAFDSFFRSANLAEDGPKPGDSDYRLPFVETHSAFQASILRLVQFEFFYTAGDDEQGMFLVLLHDARREAASLVACERLARDCLPAPGILLSEQNVTRGSDHERLRSSWARDSVHAGASIEPCPWLDTCAEEDGLPYYLWDKQERKTVIVLELQERPLYVAISHTWGRWRIDGPGLLLSGCPWLVPQNTRFQVETLGDILQAVPFSHRYIWLDLVCIPQDRSERAKLEISRQATIFREAAAAIVWLNEVQEWSALPAAVEWMCQDFRRVMDFKGKELERDIACGAGVSKTSSTIELFNPPSVKKDGNEKAPVNPWFTSLWTLQEVCLRPDMLLCNSNWDLLTVQGIPIAFDELVALNHAHFREADKRRDDECVHLPAQVGEVGTLLRSTGLFDLLEMSRPTILIQGDHRHCTERRAEAIMAVLDATDWFSTGSEDSNEKNMILDRYPLDFVNEVMAKVGPGTFFSSDSVQPYFIDILSQLSVSHEVDAVGSMLPFGPGRPKVFRDLKSEFQLPTHSSVETWTVEEPGCVRMKEVAILASSTRDFATDPTLSVVVGPVIGLAGGKTIMPQTDVDLHEWVKSYEPHSPNHAVSVFSSPKGGSMGIILKEIAPGILVKVGSYWLNLARGLVVPESTAVDWLVL